MYDIDKTLLTSEKIVAVLIPARYILNTVNSIWKLMNRSDDMEREGRHEELE